MILALMPLALARLYSCPDPEDLSTNLGGVEALPADVAPQLFIRRDHELSELELALSLFDEAGAPLVQQTLVLPALPAVGRVDLSEHLPLAPGQAYTLRVERLLQVDMVTEVDFLLSEQPSEPAQDFGELPLERLRLASYDAPVPGCEVGEAQGWLEMDLALETWPNPSGAGFVVLVEEDGAEAGIAAFRAPLAGGFVERRISHGTSDRERGRLCYFARQFDGSGALIAEGELRCAVARGCATIPNNTAPWAIAALLLLLPLRRRQ